MLHSTHTRSRQTRMARPQLYLDKEHGWLAGVCAGIGRSLRVDPDMVRVTAVIAALFMPKVVIAAYLLCWLLLDRRLTTDA